MMKSVGAAALLYMQNMLMGLIASRKRQVDAFAARLAWDETKHKVSIAPAGCGLSATQCMSDWSVLVQKRRFLLLLGDRPSYYTTLVPRAFLTSTGGAYVFTGLLRHTPLVEHISAFSCSLARQAQYSFLALGCDGTSGNLKMVAHIINTSEGDEGRTVCGGCEFVSYTLCGNHRVNLVEVAMYGYVSPTFAGDLYCTTLFLGGSGMFLRVCLAMKAMVAKAEIGRGKKKLRAGFGMGTTPTGR